MSDQSLAARLDSAVAAHQAGRFEEALQGYGAALAVAPDDAETNSLYGLALTHLRRFDEAEPYLRKAVEAEPHELGFRLNLAEMLEHAGRIDDALQEIGAVIEADPKIPRAFEKLGDLSIRAGKPGAATDAYTEAVRLSPSDYPLLMKLARAHAAFRNFRAARIVLEEAARHGPRNEAYLETYSFVLGVMGDVKALEALSREWVHKRPESAAAHRALAHAAFERGLYREAVASARRMLDLGARDADALAAYGRICLYALEYDDAAAALNEAEMLDANQPDMLAAKGLLLTYAGRFEEAEAYCRRCLAVDPGYATVYAQLSRLTGGRLGDDEKKALAELAWNKAKHAEDRAIAAFALGHALDAEGDVGQAFKVYQHANDIARDNAGEAGVAYVPADAEARMDRIRRHFAGGVPYFGDPDPRPTPIFILGMPRSGTTLVESMLSAHDAVFAGGERPDAQQLLNSYLSLAGDAEPAGSGPVNPDWIDAYYKELPDLGEAQWITDKNPLNFEAVGLIARLFPDAPIIHIRRNPVETGLSIFRHEFSKFWSFANRLEDIGHFYGQYARLMAHWDDAYPGRVTTVQYEDFAGDFETAGPALAAAIGLDWTPAMADFQKAERPIATFSTVQAREAVAVRRGKAAAYGALLDPLREALAAAGVDVETGALAG